MYTTPSEHKIYSTVSPEAVIVHVWSLTDHV